MKKSKTKKRVTNKPQKNTTNIKGVARKIVPFFDKENELYINYETVPVQQFSTATADYFLDKYEGLFFDIDSYMDTLLASFYIVSKRNNNSLPYSQPLVELFFHLFPSSVNYESWLNKQLNEVKLFLSHQQDNEKEKKKLLDFLFPLKEIFKDALVKFKSIPDNYTAYDYIAVSIAAMKKVELLINDNYDKIFLTPENQIHYNYYQTHPSLPSIECPLAFFINVLYGDGLSDIVSEGKYASDQYGDVGDLNTIIHRRYNREFYISYRLIAERIRNTKRKERQAYVDDLCLQINTLHNKSICHQIKEVYNDNLRPFTSIVRNLIGKPLSDQKSA